MMSTDNERAIPANANSNCPGPNTADAGNREACHGCPNQTMCAASSSNPAAKKVDPDLEVLALRMSNIQHKILVLSGKGGVGKSTVAAQLAFALSRDTDSDIGLLDIDICGPSIPKMLGLEGQEVHQSGNGWSPVYLEDNFGVMSIGFMLPNNDDAVIWRGPRKNALIKQFLKDVDWGLLDFLVIDAPPGTSDEHISIAQFMKMTEMDGALIVTTPQEVAIADVKKEISFCRKVGLPILGIVENMTDLMQPLETFQFWNQDQNMTAKVQEILEKGLGKDMKLMISAEVLDASKGGAKLLAKSSGIELLGSIPLDPALSSAGDSGKSIPGHTTSGKAFHSIVQRILTLLKKS